MRQTRSAILTNMSGRSEGGITDGKTTSYVREHDNPLQEPFELYVAS